MKIFNIIVFCFLFSIITINNSCLAKDFSYLGSQDEQFKKLFYKALDLEEQRKFKEAIVLLEQALDINPKQMQALGEICICYLETENPTKTKEYALKGLEIAQKIDSKDNIGRFYHNLASAYHLEENYEEAIKYFKLTLKHKPYQTSDYAPLAYSYYKIKNYDKAIKYYEKSGNEEMANEVRKAKFADFPIEKLVYSAKLYIMKNNIKKEAEFKKILELDPNNWVGLIGLAGVEKDRGNYLEAVKLGEKALPILEKKENKIYRFFYPYLYLNVLTKSYEELQNHNKSNNYFKLYLIASGTLEAYKAINEEDKLRALSCFKKALNQDSEVETEFVPYNYMAFEGIIELLIELGKYEEAKVYIQKAIEICKKENDNQRLTYFTFWVGKYYDYKKDYQNALKYYKMAYDKTSDLDNKYYYKYLIGFCYACLDDADKNMEEFKECQNLVDQGAEDIFDIGTKIVYFKERFNPDSDINKSDKHYNLCKQLFYKEKKYKEAIEQAELCLKYRPQDIGAIVILEKSLFKLGRVKEGLDTALDGINISKRDHDFSLLDILYSDIGWYYIKQNDYNKAIESFIAANDINPQNKYILYDLGYCYKRLKKYDKAIEFFEKGVKVDPNDKEMANQLEACKKLLN